MPEVPAEVEALACFEAWVAALVAHVEGEGLPPGTREAARGAKSTTN